MQRNSDFDRLEREWGIYLPEARDYLKREYAQDWKMAQDAEPALVTTANAGIPAFLTTMIDPNLIKVLVSPMKASLILGEVRKGDWVDQTAMFPIVERTGNVSSYGDFNMNGRAGVNVNWPQRQAYLYQIMKEYGELELERAGRGRIGWAAQLDEAAILILNKFQNKTYFFGVAGLQNYGLINDPSLSAALQPGPKAFGSASHGPWITSGVITATPNEIYTDIQSIYLQLVAQANGIVDLDTEVDLVLSMTAASQVALSAANSFNVSVMGLLEKNFPKMRIETAPEYALAAGNEVQMIATRVEGQDTGYCAFNEKLRQHRIVMAESSYRQKMTQGTWGAVIRQPFAIASMIGV